MLAPIAITGEDTGVNLAIIGNALRDAGAVERDYYPHLPEERQGFNKVFFFTGKREA